MRTDETSAAGDQIIAHANSLHARARVTSGGQDRGVMSRGEAREQLPIALASHARLRTVGGPDRLRSRESCRSTCRDDLRDRLVGLRLVPAAIAGSSAAGGVSLTTASRMSGRVASRSTACEFSRCRDLRFALAERHVASKCILHDLRRWPARGCFRLAGSACQKCSPAWRNCRAPILLLRTRSANGSTASGTRPLNTRGRRTMTGCCGVGGGEGVATLAADGIGVLAGSDSSSSSVSRRVATQSAL